MPSRTDVPEYAEYLERIEALVAVVNHRHGTPDWMPINLKLRDDLDEAVASYKHYDVMMVNAMFDGMNLVAKEGPLVNERDGVSILSENTGAHEELGEFALSVNPFDVQELADSIYAALTMAPEERARRAGGLKDIVTSRDPGDWIDEQIADIRKKARGGRGRVSSARRAAAHRSKPNSSSAGSTVGAGAAWPRAAGAWSRRRRPAARRRRPPAAGGGAAGGGATGAPRRRRRRGRGAGGRARRRRPASTARPRRGAAGAAPRPRGRAGAASRAPRRSSAPARGRARRSAGRAASAGRAPGAAGASRRAAGTAGPVGRPPAPGRRSAATPPRARAARRPAARRPTLPHAPRAAGGPPRAALRPARRPGADGFAPASLSWPAAWPKSSPSTTSSSFSTPRPRKSAAATSSPASSRSSSARARSSSRHDWGLRPTAYEVRKRADADYHLLQFQGPAELLQQLDHALKITDGVNRFRIIKLRKGTPRAAGPHAVRRGAAAEAQGPVEIER